MSARPRFSILAQLQPLGRALMLPIAVLPVAGLLLRLGQPDLLNIPFIASAGDAIFSNLGLLFAIGVAVGFARENNGAAGLAGVVCFLVATEGAKTLITLPAATFDSVPAALHDLAAAAAKAKALSKLGVPMGILSGVIAGSAYNRFSTLKLPEYLAFFGGRRAVPIISGFAGIGLALVFGLGWSALSSGMDGLSSGIVKAGPLGLFAYGLLNRLLIVTGLHHILNNVVWFLLGDYHGTTGDLHRFFAGDPTAGGFMSGFFPVMMFGLPAACLAMYNTAKPGRRAAVGGMLLSLALTSFLTGVTEPIEFSFMFLAPVLYAVHAVLTGLAMTVMSLLGVKLGFGFSAGLFDYVLNFKLATRPLWLIPVGAVYFGIYYGLFRYFIVRLDLKTPGREEDSISDEADESAAAPASEAEGFILAMGGAGNFISVDACTTRLRLTMSDISAIDEIGLRRLGARGFMRPGGQALQVVLGPSADRIAGEIRAALGKPRAPKTAPGSPGVHVEPSPGRPPVQYEAIRICIGPVRSALARSTRVLVEVDPHHPIDGQVLMDCGVRAWARPLPDRLHLIVGPDAPDLASYLME